MTNEKAIIGCILGTAVGDALGLPYEGVAPRRAKRLLGPPDRYRFLFGHGMISDDTEHTCMVAMSEKSTLKAPRVNPIAILPRNILFLFVVLCHGFRRVAPPY